MNLANEMLDHFLRDLEIGDHAVTQRTDCLNIAGRAAQHQLCLIPDREDLTLAAHGGDRDHGGLVQDNPATLDIDEGVSGAEVDSHIGR